MSNVNPFLDFIKSVGNPRKALMIFDVDLAIQPSMSTVTTAEERRHMKELFDITEAGVVFFTGRTHQSVEQTFDHKYPGVFEHGSVTRFAQGHKIVFVAPKIDVQKMGMLAKDGIAGHGLVRIADAPADIRESDDMAVFVEQKNTSMALVHTLKHSENKATNEAHLDAMRHVLVPIAESILTKMGLEGTHKVKVGGDAVEIVPIGPSPESRAKLEEHISIKEVDRIFSEGVSKATYIHSFQTLFDPDRRMIVTGDSAPDLEAAAVGHQFYDGKGIYVSNRIPMRTHFKNTSDEDFQKIEACVIDHIEHHTMTKPMIGDTVAELRASMPKVMPALPSNWMPQ